MKMFQQIFISIYRQKILCAKIDNKKKQKQHPKKKKDQCLQTKKTTKKKKKTTNTINYKKMKMLN
jgi:hypothetical protein